MQICHKCKTTFEIFSEEKALRESICATFETGPVPEPTLCPDCRMQRRMVRRNERHLYHRTCNLTAKSIISVYPENTPFPVYDRTAWYSDEWDATSYGRDFDFNKPFFQQFYELQNVVPRLSIIAKNVEKSDYSNFCVYCKNSYFSHCSYRCEDLFYCYWLLESKDCIDCSYCLQSEQCFDCTDCNHSYNLRSSVLSHNCRDSFFLYDCRSCQNCFGCVGLRQQSYCMFNESLGKDEYEKRLRNIDLENPLTIAEIQQRVRELGLKHPHRDSIQDKTENCTGDYIFESKNCHHCFQLYQSEDCLYVADAVVKNCLDGYHPGWSQALYEVYSPVNHQSSAFVSLCWDGSDDFYCDTCMNTTHCFGCIGLNHKNYCILNKQYSKDEYYGLLPQIVEYMKKTREWGEFFPFEISPFCYNETMAQEYYPLTKEQVLASGWRWKDQDPKEYKPQTYLIPKKIAEVDDGIVSEILKCEACGKNYRIITQELEIYRDKKIPIPHTCPDCRHRGRMNLRNPRKLWQRECMKCGASIKTTYFPERPEIVYCEGCYVKAVH